ncbi:MAG TPA: hypothetical protein VFH11_12375 [Gemmatimonadota bacterium]|nr:hypothetical protein [Gemmatimonadota bacterium]
MNRWQIAGMVALAFAGPASAQEAHSPYAHSGSDEVKTHPKPKWTSS